MNVLNDIWADLTESVNDLQTLATATSVFSSYHRVCFSTTTCRLPRPMDSVASLKPKVTVKLNYDKPNGTPPARAYGLSVHSRPPSPAKSCVSNSPQTFGFKNVEQGGQANEGTPVFRPKAKVNSSATTRRPGTAPGSTVGGSTRPSSPTKLSRTTRAPSTSTATGSTSSRGSSSVTIAGTRTPRANPPTSAPVTPQIHARSIHTPSSNGSTMGAPPAGLHHATSMSTFPVARATSVVGGSSTVSSSTNTSHRLLASRSVVGFADRERSLTSSPTLKIRSKVTAMSKSNTELGNAAAGPSSNPGSPIHATMRSTTPNPTVNLRSRRPSSASLGPSSPPPHFTSSSPASAEPKSPPNGTLRARAPSTISSGPTSPPPPQFFPITTAVSAANPHRFASARPPPAPTPPHSPPLASGSTTSSRTNSTLGLFQSFSSMPSARVPNTNRPLNGKTLSATVDPAAIPLPPHSPPASSLSFSSRSSTSHLEPRSGNVTRKYSHSRTGSASTSGGSRNSQVATKGGDLRATLDNLMQYTSGTTSEDDGSGLEDGEGEEVGEEYKVKAAAKSDRKMADLEITNRSLLSINASLEATKHRQAKEIQELRRRLREARLILPPRAFRASKDSTLSIYTDADLGLDTASSSSDEEDEDEEENTDDQKSKGDETYRRVKMLLGSLLKQGTAALEKDKEVLMGSRGGVAKVLSPEEVRDYHASGGQEDDDGDKESVSLESRSINTSDDLQSEAEHTGEEDDIPTEAETSFESMDSDDPNANMTMTSEDEVEAILGSPPILITRPS
ncbi:hypothetical protein BDN70DRAFT_23331 [Pholiota conissans]|uniref:Uncharacterized protein n=1 Tax=Pholiota conissans TaxID=109636 RepID=A0A9P6D8E5_9AGAR|nr:hypothetical protein BDN70DRAFT_23331 [Pholiota conissans]